MNPVAPGPVACFQFKSVISGKPRARPYGCRNAKACQQDRQAESE